MTGNERWIRRLVVIALSTVSSGLIVACSDEDNGTGPDEDLVTITGTVINVDTGEVAEGVRVSLLDTVYMDDRPTGGDGGFVLRVPRGSQLVLHTDDFEASTDEWFALINVETPQPVAHDNISGFITHCCPNSKGEDFGSIAVWDAYLTNEDDMNGDIFDSEISEQTDGIISPLFIECNKLEFLPPDGFGVEANGVEFVYFDNDSTFAADPPMSPDRVRHVHFGADATDLSGWAAAFVEGGQTEVELSITDRRGDRGWSFDSPIVVPTRPATITLVWLLMVDGVPNSPVEDIVPCFSALRTSGIGTGTR